MYDRRGRSTFLKQHLIPLTSHKDLSSSTTPPIPTGRTSAGATTPNTTENSPCSPYPETAPPSPSRTPPPPPSHSSPTSSPCPLPFPSQPPSSKTVPRPSCRTRRDRPDAAPAGLCRPGARPACRLSARAARRTVRIRAVRSGRAGGRAGSRSRSRGWA